MATNVPKPKIDPIEAQIHETFDRLVSCLNERRNELVTRYREIQARPADRARMEQELLKMKADTEQNIRMNLLRDTQLEILDKLERKLEEVRAPMPDTHVKFLSDIIRLEREIAGVGEFIEEKVSVGPPRIVDYEMKGQASSHHGYSRIAKILKDTPKAKGMIFSEEIRGHIH